MGWKDQSTPLGEQPSGTPSVTPTPQASQSGQPGWQSQSAPLDQPLATTAPAVPAASSVNMPAALTYDRIDPNASLGSKALSYLHNFAVGGNLSTRAADDYLTRGYGDVLQAKAENALSGPTVGGLVKQQILGQSPEDARLAQLRGQTQAAHSAMGYMDPVIGVGVNMVGPGMKAPAAVADLARAATGSKLAGWGAGALASGGVSAADAALGTLGHGGSLEDAKTSAEWGGGIGTLLGMLGVGSAGTKVAPKSVAEAAQDTASAYAPMKRVAFGENDLAPAYTNAQNGLTAAQTDDLTEAFRPGGKIDSQLNLISKNGAASADEIDGFQRNLQNAARSGADKVLATRISENLRNVLESASPITGHPIGHAADLQDIAKPAAAQLANANMIAEARRVGNLPGGGGVGETVPDAARSALKDNPQFYQGDADTAMRGLAGAGGWVPGGTLVKHAIVYPTVGAALGALGGGASGYAGAGKGEDPWVRAGERALEWGTGGLAAGYGLPKLKNFLANKALVASAPTLTAGAPYMPQAPGNQLLQAILHSRGAGYSPLSVFAPQGAPGVGASGSFVTQ